MEPIPLLVPIRERKGRIGFGQFLIDQTFAEGPQIQSPIFLRDGQAEQP